MIVLLGYLYSVPFALLLDRAVRRFLPPHEKRWRRLLPLLIFMFSTTMPTWIGDENPLFLFPFFLLAFWFGYGGGRGARLVFGQLFFSFVTAFCMIVDSAPAWGAQQEFTFLSDLYFFLPRFAVFLALLLYAERLRPAGGEVGLPGRFWAVLGVQAAGAVAVVLCFSLWEYDIPEVRVLRGNFLGAVFTSLIFSMFSVLALLFAITILARHEALVRENQLAQLRESYYRSLRQEQTGVRALRHDLRNHLTAVRGLLEQGEAARAARYLDELADSPALRGSKRFCANETANVVLTSKAERMARHGLTPDISAELPEGLPVSDADLCALLGNALDNAIEAAEQADDKTVRVRARADRGLLMLRVENGTAGAVRQRDGAFPTTKPNRAAHGFGLAQMRGIAAQYGGSLEARAENGRFELVVCLPIL